MITLESDRLRIELPEPGKAPNTSQRFDRAGFISEVILDGSVRFCASEPNNLSHPSSGGRGLCNEYRFEICENVPTGDYFPKFGVGLYRKEEEGKFVFHRKYKDIVPFEIDMERTKESALFTTQPTICYGYALKTVKTVSIEENTLTMTIEARNVGEKSIFLEEFCHNFLSVDGMAVGSDYRLDLPQCPDLGYNRLDNRNGTRPGSMRGDGKGITFCEFTAIATDFAIDPANIEKKIPFTWKLTHRGAKASVSCEEGFEPHKITVWAVDHMVCPEIVIGLELSPGSSQRWTRKWRFEAQRA